jgi:hypothetical protein
LIDGSTVRTPGVGVYLADPKRTNMENYGVQPDIRVDNAPEDNLAGRDRQLEAAVDELLRQLGAAKRNIASKEQQEHSNLAKFLAIIVVAAVAVPLALPTFFEIPLALILLASGTPVGAAVAMLIAGPAINLPSLLTIARSTNWKVAMTVAGVVMMLAIAGGLLVTVL